MKVRRQAVHDDDFAGLCADDLGPGLLAVVVIAVPGTLVREVSVDAHRAPLLDLRVHRVGRALWHAPYY